MKERIKLKVKRILSHYNFPFVFLKICESWTLTKDLERRLEAADMWSIRRIMRIPWTEKKSNEEAMEMAGYKRSLLKTIRKKDNYKFWGI